ncbi:MAG: putative Ig domain-containing protein [Actinomycetota bacterium]|nr:putative Ig domain-containing protein [Actinomycetota bacterium]
MNYRSKGMRVLIGTAAITVGMTGTALATPASPGSTAASIAYSCSQRVAKAHFACMSVRRTDVGFTPRSAYAHSGPQSAGAQATAQATPGGYGPSSLQAAYKLPSASAGSGQRVYVVDAYDNPTAESDLAAYRSQFGLPACTTANGCFQKLNQSGQTSPLPSPDAGWAGEISLDLDMVSAICPNCAITLIESNDNGMNLYSAVQEAANLGGKFVSMSWGGGDSSSDSSIDSGYFRSSGVVYTASTGDGAYSAGVIYPASSPYVVAVGGTSLVSAANARGWSETVWKNSSSQGTGSGCSAYEPKPAWQSIVSSTVCSRRADSDVSAVADPYTGVAVYQTYGGGGWTIYGGTSAAAPIIASVYALAGTPGASDKPGSEPYAHTGNLFDVTSGNNGTCYPSLLCTAAVGWDGPTGLGTPNGTAAFTAGGGGGTGNTVTVNNPGSQSGTVGAPASLQVSAVDSGGATLTYTATGLPPGLSINSSTGLVSGTPTSSGGFNVTVGAHDATGAAGSATFTWTIANAVGTGCSGQLVKNSGFESGSTSWAATAGVIQTDGAHAHSGRGYSWLDGYGTSHVDTLSQAVTIPSGCHATLSYDLYISSADTSTTAHDTLTVAAGSTTVQSFSNVNRGSGYVLRSVDVSAFAGQTVTLKWTGIENASLATSFFVDDVAVNLS